MPRGDGTGPYGNADWPCRRGAGMGRGWRRTCFQPVNLTKEEQKKILAAELQEIEKRLLELDEKKE
jgi:hypothetical protein